MQQMLSIKNKIITEMKINLVKNTQKKIKIKRQMKQKIKDHNQFLYNKKNMIQNYNKQIQIILIMQETFQLNIKRKLLIIAIQLNLKLIIKNKSFTKDQKKEENIH
ncbi:hypothetical protein IMG5_168420 [Ichthyophthirius multifiliis]|uniref:Uncharacterized protein n=1 Tax=Ichthyophthirius multifiliis TaxID=5932 RepID=G0R139_ICHMU|nr:hypothetical protein IMG5_168420 [Ichthyophthirius multifiliis]EGR28806.1 hypothetical protein IMG5_168420 [Ichthyophthirius multifiliis]|eukprot:XP_004030042.1 hypothetical protein IMG5_168420 [Ichthyophthirius multifiliis]